MKKLIFVVSASAALIGSALAAGEADEGIRIEESLAVASVVSEFPVGFSLLTAGQNQYVAYYDEARNMTVASRTLGSEEWKYRILPSKIAWDSHNYITMAVDGDGHLHLTGNMHNVKLLYFRTEKQGDISTLERIPMTGEREDRVTYPQFLRDHEDRLLFTYRDGGSGNGVQIFNKYDRETRTWSRLLDTPLLDGEKLRSAYPSAPIRGPDGLFHMVWVWRDTPDCATNNHLSYARSKDMVHWESAFGEEAVLPLNLGQKQLWVDPIPSGGGIINGGANLAFDGKKQPVITYHKNDPDGNMQIYAARPGKWEWSLHQLTAWEKAVEFSGNGSMGFVGIRVSPFEQVEPGILSMTYQHRDYGGGRITVNEGTFEPMRKKITDIQWIPKELNRIQSDFKGMEIKRQGDSGAAGDPGVRYFLQWETLPSNRDKGRIGPLPEPSVLKLYKVSRG